MFCTTCGTMIPDKSKFCTHCGTKFININSLIPKEEKEPLEFKEPVFEELSSHDAKTNVCKACGVAVSNSSKFCTSCGYNFLDLADSPTAGIELVSFSDTENVTMNVTSTNLPVCTNCGAEVPGESKFCTSCGERVSENKLNIPKQEIDSNPLVNPVDLVIDCSDNQIFKVCHSCGIQIPQKSKFCSNCGASETELNTVKDKEWSADNQQKTVVVQEQAPEIKNIKSRKSLFWGLLILGIIISASAGVIIWSNSLTGTDHSTPKAAYSSDSINAEVQIKSTYDTLLAHQTIDTQKTLLIVDSIIKNHEISSNVRLNEEIRKTLTDSLLDEIIKGGVMIDKITGSLNVYTKMPATKEVPAKSKEIKVKRSAKNKRSSKFDKFK